MDQPSLSDSWIRVNRNVFDHPMFEGEPFSRRDAWVWLIANAAWKDTTHWIKNKMHPVPRGSLFCTLRELAKVWHWKSDKKVRGFLRGLEMDAMITVQGTHGKTQITICNYSVYQDARRTEDAKRDAIQDAPRTHGGRTKGTNKQNTTLTGVEQLEELLREAAGLQNAISPALMQISDPLSWLNAECDLELDILPTLRAKTHSGVRTWNYFTNAVHEARAKRLAAKPDLRVVPCGPAQSKTEKNIQALLEVGNEFTRKGR